MEISGEDYPYSFFWGMDGGRVLPLLESQTFRFPNPRPTPSTAIKGKGVQSSPPPRKRVKPSDGDPLPKEGPSKSKTNHPSGQSQWGREGEGCEGVIPNFWKGRTERKVGPIGG